MDSVLVTLRTVKYLSYLVYSNQSYFYDIIHITEYPSSLIYGSNISSVYKSKEKYIPSENIIGP